MTAIGAVPPPLERSTNSQDCAIVTIAESRSRGLLGQGPSPSYLVPVKCPSDDAANVRHSSVTRQVLSAGLAEFNKEIEPAPMHVAQHLVHSAIRGKVGLNNRVECPLGSCDDWSG